MLSKESKELHVKFYKKFELLYFIYPYPGSWTKVPLVLLMNVCTLESGIVVLVGISVLVGTFVKINKRTGPNKHTGVEFLRQKYHFSLEKAMLKWTKSIMGS